MRGVIKCVPGYSVPGRTPEIWLMRTAALPSGTTRMHDARRAQIAAAITSLAAAAHRIARLDRSIRSCALTGVGAVTAGMDGMEADGSPVCLPPALSWGGSFGLSHWPTWEIRKIAEATNKTAATQKAG